MCLRFSSFCRDYKYRDSISTSRSSGILLVAPLLNQSARKIRSKKFRSRDLNSHISPWRKMFVNSYSQTHWRRAVRQLIFWCFKNNSFFKSLHQKAGLAKKYLIILRRITILLLMVYFKRERFQFHDKTIDKKLFI